MGNHTPGVHQNYTSYSAAELTAHLVLGHKILLKQTETFQIGMKLKDTKKM